MKHFLILSGWIITAAFTFPVYAADDLEGRVGRLERIFENQSGSDLLLQVQRLQAEMQELRGLVETQKLNIDKLQRQQRDQYLDIDARLGTNHSTAPQTPLPNSVVDASGTSTDEPAPAPVAAPIAPPSTGPIGIPALPQPETQSGNERDAYATAFALLKERNYDAAKTAFTQLLQSYPQGEFTDSAQYWLGETNYVQRDYPAALEAFNQLIQNHPNSPKIANALLRIGSIQYDQKAFAQAKISLEQLISRFPNSTEARLARSRLERINDNAP
ncbi:tol-pal system protein YbgF [Chromatium okenii]|uniref:tol-pal system protein YbgF n=1 Tax=Chromatium okenii TaxID=61644 RepID=UPI0026F2627C|nr:tol-pal system protein YbgF [Chromatium okenii]MBV5308999.1 tol-pal system protein YbgF [Chromatium okenii]